MLQKNCIYKTGRHTRFSRWAAVCQPLTSNNSQWFASQFCGLTTWMGIYCVIFLALARLPHVSAVSCQAGWGWLVWNGLSCSRWSVPLQPASLGLCQWRLGRAPRASADTHKVSGGPCVLWARCWGFWHFLWVRVSHEASSDSMGVGLGKWLFTSGKSCRITLQSRMHPGRKWSQPCWPTAYTMSPSLCPVNVNLARISSVSYSVTEIAGIIQPWSPTFQMPRDQSVKESLFTNNHNEA